MGIPVFQVLSEISSLFVNVFRLHLFMHLRDISKHIALSSLSCSTFVLKMSLRERQQRETFWFFFANVSVCFRKKHFVGASTSVCCDLILNSIHPWSDVYWKEIDSRKQCKEKSRTKHVIWFGCCVLELRFLCCMHIAQTWANTKNHR